MDFISLFYFKELTKDLNMTRTANRLYISQQTLSNHILRLEKEVENQLFYRKPNFKLTYAGEKMLEFTESVLMEQKNIKNLMLDISKENIGNIKFGASSLRMNAALPNILPSFHKKYPNVSLDLIDGVSRTLEPLLSSGEIDIALIAYDNFNPDLNKELIINELIYICVPNDILIQCYGENILNKRKQFINGVELDELKELPFLSFNNRLGRKIKKCFDDLEYEPNVFISSSYMQVLTTIGLTGIAAFFNTQLSMSLYKKEIPTDLNIFPLMHKGEFLYQKIYLGYNNKLYKTSYINYFSELLFEYFSQIEHKSIIQIAKNTKKPNN